MKSEEFVWAALSLLIAFVLQVAVAPYIAVGDIAPNFFLIFGVIYALSRGSEAGAIFGFIAGFLFDLLGTGPVGPMAMSLAIMGYLAGFLHTNLFSAGWTLPVIVIVAASLASEVLYMIMILFLGGGSSFMNSFVTIVLPSVVFDGVVATIFAPIFMKIYKQSTELSALGRLR